MAKAPVHGAAAHPSRQAHPPAPHALHFAAPHGEPPAKKHAAVHTPHPSPNGPVPHIRHPHLAAAFQRIRQSAEAEKGAVRQNAEHERRNAIEKAHTEDAAIRAMATAKFHAVTSVLNDHHAQITQAFASTRARVTEIAATHAGIASANGARAIADLNKQTAVGQKSAAAAAEEEAGLTEKVGASEAARIQESENQTTAALKLAAANAVAGVGNEEAEVINDVKKALQETSEDLMKDVRDRTKDLGSAATDTAGKAAGSIRDAGQSLASSMGDQSFADVEKGMTEGTAQTVQGLHSMSAVMITHLLPLEMQAVKSLEAARAHAALAIHHVSAAAVSHAHEASSQIVAGIAAAESTAVTQIDTHVHHAMLQASRVPAKSPVTPADAQALSAGAAASIRQASGAVNGVISDVNHRFSHRLQDFRSVFGAQLSGLESKTHHSAATMLASTHKALDTATGFARVAAENAVTSTDAGNKDVVAKVQAELQKPVDASRKTWAQQRDDLTKAIKTDIDKGAQQNADVRAAAPDKFAETAKKAVEHAHASLASRIFSGIWEGIKAFAVGLLIFFAVVLAVFLLIMLVALAIGAVVAAGTALAWALAIVGVAFLLYGFITAMIHRSQQFWARYGTDIPWYAQVGGFFWVFAVAVGDTFGVSGILEGALRMDLVSGEHLTPEEAAKRATQGVLTLAFIFLMKGVVKKLGGPRAIPDLDPDTDPNAPPETKPDPKPRLPRPPVPPGMPDDLAQIRNGLQSDDAAQQFDSRYEAITRKHPENPTDVELQRFRAYLDSLRKRNDGDLEKGLVDDFRQAHPEPKAPFGDAAGRLPQLRAKVNAARAEIEAIRSVRLDLAAAIEHVMNDRFEPEVARLERMENGQAEANSTDVDSIDRNTQAVLAEVKSASTSPSGTRLGAKFTRPDGSKFEIDEVSPDGSRWVQVKNTEPFDTGSKNFTDVQAQAARNLADAKNIGSLKGPVPTDGKPPAIEFRFTKGVVEDVAAALESMGVRVTGLLVTRAQFIPPVPPKKEEDQ